MTTPHPLPDELLAYARRRLPPARMVALDWHLSHCAECREQLQATHQGAGSRAAHQAVVRAGQHATFEQLQGLVDCSLSPAELTALETHLASCPMCRREASDLARHAQALRQPLAAPAAPSTRPFAAWWHQLGSSPAWAGGAAVALALGVILWHERPGAPPGGRGESLQLPETAGSAAVPQGFVHVTESQLNALAPEIGRAYRAKNFASAARQLQALVERGSPGAASALASLTAQGLGVAADLDEARRLWTLAAEAGDPDAAANLAALGQR